MSDLNANNDHGIWLEQIGTRKLSGEWSIRLKTGQRIGSNYRKLWQERYECVVLYNLRKYFPLLDAFNIGIGDNPTYSLSRDTQGHHHWVWVNRPLIETSMTLAIKNWKLSQRLRGEYSQFLRSHYHSHGVYRHRLTLECPWKATCLKIAPYLSNEWFFRNNSYRLSNPTGLVGGYFENRFRAGFETEFSENIHPAFYWQWRTIKQKPGNHPGWSNTFQYGLDLRYNF